MPPACRRLPIYIFSPQCSPNSKLRYSIASSTSLFSYQIASSKLKHPFFLCRLPPPHLRSCQSSSSPKYKVHAYKTLGDIIHSSCSQLTPNPLIHSIRCTLQIYQQTSPLLSRDSCHYCSSYQYFHQVYCQSFLNVLLVTSLTS